MFQNGDGVQILWNLLTNSLIRVRYFLGGALTSKQVEDVGPANGDAANLDVIPSVCMHQEAQKR